MNQHALTVLFDYDSLIYKAVYKVVDIQTMKQWFSQGKDKDWMRSKIVEEGINRLVAMAGQIFTEIEDTGILIGEVEYYITNAPKSRRRLISKAYKSNRKPNKWVNQIRKYLIEMAFAKTHPEWEADDLISDRAKELGADQCLILTMDKDLKQIPGIHFNYYRPKVTNENGVKVSGDAKGLEVVSNEEARYSFWISMLTGDHGDKISGINGIGPKKGAKILDGKEDLKAAVMETYQSNYGTSWNLHFMNNYRLLGLGTKLFT